MFFSWAVRDEGEDRMGTNTPLHYFTGESNKRQELLQVGTTRVPTNK